MMIFQGKEFRKYDEHYYVSADGDIYSTYKKGLLKHSIDLDGYHRVDIHSKHMKVHKLVYLVWGGPIPDGKQLNHIDDNKDNNSFILGLRKKTSKIVFEMALERVILNQFGSMTELLIRFLILHP